MFRNIFRRKLRAFLTIFGITIGVFALVVMGSMAEKINLLVDGGIRYYSDKVIVTDASTAMSGFSDTPIAVSRIGEIESGRRRGRGLRQHLHAARPRGRHDHGRAAGHRRQRPAGHRATRSSS